jgi:hypothetical protein
MPTSQCTNSPRRQLRHRPQWPPRPADRHAFTLAPTLHTLAKRVDTPGDLVTGGDRELQTRQYVVDENRIGVADAAGFHRDPHTAGCRIGQCSIDKGQWSSR